MTWLSTGCGNRIAAVTAPLCARSFPAHGPGLYLRLTRGACAIRQCMNMRRNPTGRGGGPHLSRFARSGGAAAAMLGILSGCATPNELPAKDSVEIPAVEAPEPYNYERAFELLHEGQAERAERMLEAHLETSPGDDRARGLLRQIQVPPKEYLGGTSFEYRVESGDTLSELSQRFLGSYRLFFILARYNDLDTPSLLRAGQVLRIPGGYANKAAASDGAPADGAGTGRAQPMSIGPRGTWLSRESLDGGIPGPPQQGSAREEAPPERTLAEYSGVEVDALGREETAKLGAAYQRWADEALMRGDTGEAGNRLAEAERRAPSDGRWEDWLDDMKQRMTAEAVYRDGLDLREREPAAAARAFARALHVDPDHTGARSALADLRQHTVPQLHQEAVDLYSHQKLDEAIDIWDQILGIDPEFGPAQEYRTRALELRRQFEEQD